MGVTIQTTCDYPVRRRKCGEPTELLVEVAVDNMRYKGYLCKKTHLPRLDEALAAIGIEAVESRINYKGRGVHKAASGKTFTTKEARDWLVEQGVTSHKTGVLSKEHLELYAASH